MMLAMPIKMIKENSMAAHIEVIKTLTIPDYDVEMCIVSVSGELFIMSPDFDTRIPYCGTLDLDDGVIAVIMAEAYEKVLELSMAEFELQRISIFGALENALGSADQCIKH
ncbi:hypothetical protein ACM64K_18360 (plasmid) [Klebsiella pneumoniae]|nr:MULTISPECIES: hypothetical protein [Enterobacterales]EKV0915234.1 hypothetical protein [Pluralibacter gergoviae]EKW2294120.1 hypothetical protein [Klebsiella variicola]ELB4229793.1 hypothetical protein [Citrobacter amalonaticus]MCU2303563.1 hypothetical protein [Enterobacter hormaechei subsp. steigerwaltii]MCU2460801.1 hypothetical protein [Enterobacter hormaechei subsp. hoffmannii]MCU3611506.1 hypothetical protein [Enterobacter hormaechei subsp. oharae]